ncbi:MAG: hypothetical protein RSA29_17850 [Clostridium sp.]|uniref:hypothetical protein n=1 Tax=Clostridium sp. TaxID=1506 RepID=UPI00305AFA5E
MKEVWKVYKDVIIPLVISILIVIVNIKCTFSSDIVEIIMASVPIIIISISVILNKPRIINKIIRLLNAKNNINVISNTVLNDIYINQKEFSSISKSYYKRFPENLSKKVLKEDIGDYIYKSTILIESLGISEITYNVEENSILFKVENNIPYKTIYKRFQNTSKNLNESIAEQGKGYVISKSNLEIKFLSDSEDITNPVVAMIYKGFKIKSFELKYEGKYNSIINIYKDRISIFNKDNLNLMKDFKNELMFF